MKYSWQRQKELEGKMKVRNWNGATVTQQVIIILIAPGPWGESLEYVEAAKKLGMKFEDFNNEIKVIKRKFKEGWDEYESMWRAARRLKPGLKRPYSIEECKLDRYINQIYAGKVKPNWKLVELYQRQATGDNVMLSGMESWDELIKTDNDDFSDTDITYSAAAEERVTHQF